MGDEISGAFSARSLSLFPARRLPAKGAHDNISRLRALLRAAGDISMRRLSAIWLLDDERDDGRHCFSTGARPAPDRAAVLEVSRWSSAVSPRRRYFHYAARMAGLAFVSFFIFASTRAARWPRLFLSAEYFHTSIASLLYWHRLTWRGSLLRYCQNILAKASMLAHFSPFASVLPPCSRHGRLVIRVLPRLAPKWKRCSSLPECFPKRGVATARALLTLDITAAACKSTAMKAGHFTLAQRSFRVSATSSITQSGINQSTFAAFAARPPTSRQASSLLRRYAQGRG